MNRLAIKFLLILTPLVFIGCEKREKDEPQRPPYLWPLGGDILGGNTK